MGDWALTASKPQIDKKTKVSKFFFIMFLFIIITLHSSLIAFVLLQIGVPYDFGLRDWENPMIRIFQVWIDCSEYLRCSACAHDIQKPVALEGQFKSSFVLYR